MTIKYIIDKTKIYLVAGLLPLAGCTDDFLVSNKEQVNNSDLITFTASVSCPASDVTRSSTTVPYEPLELHSAEDSSYPLYLHTYEHALGEDIADMGIGNTRGAQVNSPKDLYDIHKSFAVRGVFFEEGQELIHVHDTRRVSAANYNYWTLEESHRWIGDRKVQFTAVAPYASWDKLEDKDFSQNRLAFSYTAEKSAGGETDAESQADLLTAVATFGREDTEPYNYRVPLKFHHALSAVKFAVRDVLKGKVISVKVSGIKGSGDCVYTADYTSENGQFVWTNQSGNESYTQIFNHDIEDGYNTKDDPTKDVVLNDKMPEKTFMFIPQELTENAEIEVIIAREGVTPSRIRMRAKILDNDVKEWKAGHEYVYTISTSKSNWTYVFDVNGSYRNKTEIYMPSPADEEIYNTFVEGGGTSRPYYEVVSYRYRTNNPDVKENLPWEASHGDGKQYYYNTIYDTFAQKDAILYENRDRGDSERAAVPGAQWLKDLHATPLRGNGSTAAERHNLSFLSPIVTTNWDGDIEMYKKSPYPGNSETNPWDLSTFGGQRGRNTANCYVVDREGWYAIPLYYGNAVKEGGPNPSSWEVSDAVCPDRTLTKNSLTFDYLGLRNFKDHKGSQIGTVTGNTGRIPTGYYRSAHLLWQDSYNVVENVKLATVDGEQMIVFHVNKENLQQGNAIIGLSEHAQSDFSANADAPRIVWSWHIWFNEHWLNDAGLSNAFADSGFDTEILEGTSDMQNQGDLEVTVPRTSAANETFHVAPYNIGWCDAKTVRYLSRYNKMNFVQYQADGTSKTGKTGELPIIQDGRTIVYRIGNNVYFQFGRKDPFVGFIDNNSELKPNYGRLRYKTRPQLRSIAYSIMNPHELFVGSAPDENMSLRKTNSDWNAEDNWNNSSTSLTEYYNLWNSSSYDKTERENVYPMTDREFFTAVKTVYDPSPAGYMVPPVGFFKILFREDPVNYEVTISDIDPGNLETVLNGHLILREDDNPIYRIYIGRSSTDKFFSLTGTGNRWYATDQVGAGGNFNPQIAYLWSSNVTKSANDRSAYSVAVGLDDNAKYIVSGAFCGRKAMARPVRCVRER